MSDPTITTVDDIQQPPRGRGLERIADYVADGVGVRAAAGPDLRQSLHDFVTKASTARIMKYLYPTSLCRLERDRSHPSLLCLYFNTAVPAAAARGCRGLHYMLCFEVGA